MAKRHWVVLLALLDEFIGKKVRPELEKLRKKGVKLDEIDDVQSATLAGPVVIRGIIVKELAARGTVKPEANAELGIDNLNECGKIKQSISEPQPPKKPPKKK